MSLLATPPPSPSQQPVPFPHRQKLFLLLSLFPLFLILFSPRGEVNSVPIPFLNRYPKQPRDIVNLTLTLAQISSPSGHEQKVFKYAEEWLSSQSTTVHKQLVPPLTPAHEPRQNLLATYGEISDIEVLLSTHLDTVPGGPVPHISNDSLVGRGVVDAKVQAAAFMITLVEMADPRVGLLLVSGEETDHKGMIFASKMGIPDGVTMLNGEPTESMVAARQKGMLRGLIKVVGRRAHSGYPHLGVSAVDKLLDIIEVLRKLWPGDNGETMNIGVITGGTAPNIVAGEAEARILWRVIDKADVVVDKVKEVVDGYEGVTFDVITMNDALELYVPEKAGGEFGVTDVAYNTDIPYYRGSYKRAIVFGGGSITVAHTEEEGMSIADMKVFGKRVKMLVEELL